MRMLIRKIGVIGRTYRQIERYSEILGVLFKFGFGDLVISLRVEQYLDIGRQMFLREKKKKVEGLSRAVRIRMALEELGPTFIKLGQMLSMRPDILPAEFADELSKLQDQVPAFPFEDARRIMETELGAPLYDVFNRIDEEPLAAASIGQVHRARLTDGEEVVVKVQRPGIRRTVEVDLEILLHLATLLERHVEGWDVHRPTDVVDEFGRTLELEMDYGIEAGHMERLAGVYFRDARVYIPKVYRHLTTPSVLTMEYVEGIPLGDLERLKASGYDLKELAALGGELVLEQTLVNGFFHADPHPGNLLALPGNVIGLLDMGMMGRIDRKTRENMVDLLMGLVRHEPAEMVTALLRITEWEDEPDRRALEREAAAFIDQHFNRPLKELELGKLLQQVFRIATEFRLRVPPDLFLLIKALTVVEGLGRKLDPDFDVVSKAAPFVKRVQLERYHPKRLAGDLWDYSGELLELIRELPGEIRNILRMARQGKLQMEVILGGLEKLHTTQDRSSNRLAFAIVLAAMVVGSSIIIHSGIPPTWHGIPIIGLAGYVVAGLMGFWLLISILRRGML